MELIKIMPDQIQKGMTVLVSINGEDVEMLVDFIQSGAAVTTIFGSAKKVELKKDDVCIRVIKTELKKDQP